MTTIQHVFRLVKFPALCTTLAAATLAANGAFAGADTREDKGVFLVYYSGFRVGTLTFTGASTATQYSASGLIRSTGLARMFVDARYTAESQGRITARGFVPTRYTESANTGKRASQAVMEYRRGVPQVKEYSPPKAPSDHGVDPATQGGTLDPMTVIYAVLRDVPVSEICTLDVKMFDGKRRSQVRFFTPTPQGSSLACEGEYRRLEGFTPKEMAERQVYPIRLTYAPAPNGMYHVQRMILTTDIGLARLVRR